MKNSNVSMQTFMIKQSMRLFLIGLVVVCLAACGGGGSSSGGGVVLSPGGTVISGSVAKGIFSSGIVECYLVDGAVMHLLSSARISSTGRYAVNIGSYQGIVLLKVVSGIYNDEATGNPHKALNVPLRAAVVIAGTSQRNVSITPLTELAVRKALSLADPLTAEAVTAANENLSDIFPFDILATTPLPLYRLTSGTAEQKCYSLVLAGVSMYGVETFLNEYETDLTTVPFKIDAARLSKLSVNTQDFLDLGSPANPTGYTSVAEIPKFDMVGWNTTIVTISADSSGSAYTLANGIQFSLRINPAKLALDTDPNHPKVPDSSVVTLMNPNASLGGGYAITSDNVSSWTVLNIALAYQNGIAQGDIATVRLKTKPGEFLNNTDIYLERLYNENVETNLPYTYNNTTEGVEWILTPEY